MNRGEKGGGGPESTTGGAASPRSPRRLQASALLGGDRELILLHGDAEYRLRLTSNDKLILTK